MEMEKNGYALRTKSYYYQYNRAMERDEVLQKLEAMEV